MKLIRRLRSNEKVSDCQVNKMWIKIALWIVELSVAFYWCCATHATARIKNGASIKVELMQRRDVQSALQMKSQMKQTYVCATEKFPRQIKILTSLCIRFLLVIAIVLARLCENLRRFVHDITASATTRLLKWILYVHANIFARKLFAGCKSDSSAFLCRLASADSFLNLIVVVVIFLFFMLLVQFVDTNTYAEETCSVPTPNQWNHGVPKTTTNIRRIDRESIHCVS